ncbi:MAG: hypothetical protein QOH42_77 [Blastocatellia bacterium]|nr:hypothetical protein [Blastocatellia bacterium]
MTRNQLAPKARKNKLIVKELPGEVLIYDEDNHKAHCLNETAALVWKFCDGRTSIPKMTRLLEKEMNVAVPQQMVWLAIKELEGSRLLDMSATQQSWIPQTSRRAVLRTIGIAAVALPLITTITNPTAAAAATCVPGGQPCSPPGSNPGNCCPGFACNGAGVCQAT